jgi:iron complex transport system substrate-binding protein
MDRPLRVVSVLPSATEMLCFIGGGHLLVGRSHEDNYPESITHLPVVTGQLTEFTTAVDVDRQVSSALSTGQSLYTIDEQLLTTLQPDVILTQDICAVCAIDLQTVQRLAARMSPQPRVVSLNPLGLDDVLDNLLQVGEAVGMEREAQAARAGLEARLRRADELVATSQAAAAATAAAKPAAAAAKGVAAAEEAARPCVAFIEWPEPLYVGGHWTPQLIERAGGAHPLNPARPGGAAKSFAVTAEAMVATVPRLAILAPCGLNLQQTRRGPQGQG